MMITMLSTSALKQIYRPPPLVSPSPDPAVDIPEFEELDEADRRVCHRFKHVLMQGSATTPTMPSRAAQRVALSQLPHRTQLALIHHNGKDSIDRCFMTERTFRHVLVYIFKSDFLEPIDRRRLCKSCPSALLLWMMLKQHKLVDFRSLRSAVLPTNVKAGRLMHRWSRMFTACLLHYNLDVATAVRFVGNIHTGEHRNWTVLESELRDAGLDNGVVADLRRVLVDGCPNYVNAWSSETNRRAFAEYGNHDSVYKNPKKKNESSSKRFPSVPQPRGQPSVGLFPPRHPEHPARTGCGTGKKRSSDM